MRSLPGPRGSAGGAPARSGVLQEDLWWSQELRMPWDVLSGVWCGDWVMLGAEPWLFPLSADQPARRWC